MKEIAIVLLNYNNHEDTLECVRSISENCSLNYGIIIVDNNSRIESQKVLIDENKKYDYKLILNSENKGFSSGNNIGIKDALKDKYKYILLLNNDTLITKNSIEIMLEELKKEKELGITTCRIMHYPEKNKIWYDGGTINWNRYAPTHKNVGVRLDECDIEEVRGNVEFISGCCMLIKAEVFEKVGYLPEEFFMYLEDVDFCINVIRKEYKMRICRDSIIYHKVSAASGGEESPFSIRWGNRNRLLLIKKNKDNIGFIKYRIIISRFLLERLIKIFQYLLTWKIDKVKALSEGIIDALRIKINI